MRSGWFSEKVYQRGNHVRVCITHLLSIKKINVGDFHVSVAINNIKKNYNVFVKFDLYIIDV